MRRSAALRREHPALQQGATVWLHNSDEQHVVTYLRRAGSEEFLIAVNLSNTPFRGSVEASRELEGDSSFQSRNRNLKPFRWFR